MGIFPLLPPPVLSLLLSFSSLLLVDVHLTKGLLVVSIVVILYVVGCLISTKRHIYNLCTAHFGHFLTLRHFNTREWRNQNQKILFIIIIIVRLDSTPLSICISDYISLFSILRIKLQPTHCVLVSR